MNKYYFKLRRTKYDIAKYVCFNTFLLLPITSMVLLLFNDYIYTYVIVLTVNIFLLLYSIFFFSPQRCLVINNDEILILEKGKGKIVRHRVLWKSIESVCYISMNNHRFSSEQLYIQGREVKIGIKEPFWSKTIRLNAFSPFSFKEYAVKGKGYHNIELNNILQNICKNHRIRYECTTI